MKRLNTDQEIAPIVAQFVPVKLDVSSEEYAAWRRDHPSEGNTIPKLFVVRADGETLYGKSGSLQGAELPQMLARALQNSGLVLNQSQTTALVKAADDFERLSGEGDIAQAVKSLNRIRKIGEPGKIPSYSAPASRVNELVIATATEIKTELESLGEAIDGETPEQLQAILAFLKLKQEYGALKILKPDFAAFQKSNLTKENSQLAREAKIIDAARLANSKSKKTRAIERLIQLIDSTEIDEVKTEAEKVKTDLESDQW